MIRQRSFVHVTRVTQAAMGARHRYSSNSPYPSGQMLKVVIARTGQICAPDQTTVETRSVARLGGYSGVRHTPHTLGTDIVLVVKPA
jgi:hypothetical protein